MPPTDALDTAERLARVETKIDFLIESLKNLPPHKELVEKDAAIEVRVTKLETFVNRAIGVIIAANVLLTLFAYKLKALIP